MTAMQQEDTKSQASPENELDLPFFNAAENRTWRSMRGFLSVDGARTLYRYARDSSPDGEAVEVGSLAGKSTVCIARALRDSRKAPRLTSVDIRFQPDYASNLKKFDVSDYVTAWQMPSLHAADRWNKPISFIYIDGFHAKAHAYADLMSWDQSLLVGGTMALDDTYGFFVGPALQLQAAVRTGAYEPLGNFGGVSFLRKNRPIIADIGDYPLQPGSLAAYVDFVGTWIGAMDPELRLPLGQPFPKMTERKSLQYLVNRAMDMSPREAIHWVNGKLPGRRASGPKRDARAEFVNSALVGAVSILEWLESQTGLDQQAHSTIAYLRGCLELHKLQLRPAMEILRPLTDLGTVPLPHYNVEIRQLALLRLAQAHDLADERDQAMNTYRRLINEETIDEIRARADLGLARPFQLPDPSCRDLETYVIAAPLFKYKNLI